MERTNMERTNGISLWRQIELSLTDEIRAGTWAEGQQLPTEAALAMRFNVNRHTLRRAMGALEAAGVVRIEQGRGTFVQEDVVDYPVSKRTRYAENMASNNRQAGGQLLRSAQAPADREVARALGIRLNDKVLMLELLRVADNRPLSVSTHWFPRSRCDGIIDAFEKTQSITKALKQIGIADYVRASTRITTRLPLGDEGRLLKQARSQPVLVSESINCDPSGRPIEYVMARFASQRVQFVFEF